MLLTALSMLSCSNANSRSGIDDACNKNVMVYIKKISQGGTGFGSSSFLSTLCFGVINTYCHGRLIYGQRELHSSIFIDFK